MLKGFRKTKKEQLQDALVGKQEEVTFEAMPEALREFAAIESGLPPQPPEPPESEPPALSPEERRLKEAREHLEAVKAQNVDAMTVQEAEEAQRKLEEAQRKLDRVRSEQDRRFHEANRLVMEAEADIQEAKRQKQVWAEVSNALNNFQASPAGQGIPDESALILGMMMGIIGSSEHNWLNIGNSQYFTVAIRDWMRSMTEIAPKIATYHAYRKRIGLE